VTFTVTETPRPSRPERIGRYRVIDRIGRGAMGVVYSAHDEMMGRDVAVKVMMTDLEAEPDIRVRFMREAQVSASLAHRNIVTIYDIGEDNGRLFIVMELLRGYTLDKCLKQRMLPIEEKVDLILDVCEGLGAANAAGVCHRDVKPANLFIQADGGVKILDFGIARLASSSMTASGFIVGTPDYMSPEQARGSAVDERSDIFSVGAVLYVMLSGVKPFAAPDLPAVLSKVVNDEPPPLDPHLVPSGLARVVLKALAKDPGERFQTFEELSAELSRWRRRFDLETKTITEGVAVSLEWLLTLATEERDTAGALGVEREATLEQAIAELGASFPVIQSGGAAALRAARWNRDDIQDIGRRISAIAERWEPQVAARREARREVIAATRQLESGNARAALAGFENVLRRVPSAPIHPLVAKARELIAQEQARDERVRALLAEATTAQSNGRLQAARALVEEAVSAHPQHVEARTLLERLQRDAAAAELEKARRCERCLARARRALQLEQFEEAEHQLQLATETGAANADIAVVMAALNEARAARDSAGAQLQEIAAELASARAEFQEGRRREAIARLEALESRLPSSAATQAELARLRDDDRRLAAAEQAQTEAARLAGEAAAALASGDDARALKLADDALRLIPSHESALRTSIVASAHERENKERAARAARAQKLLQQARASLASGQFEQAIKEARDATELDPSGTEALAVIADAYRRRAAAEAALAAAREAARRAAEVDDLLTSAGSALRNKDFARARTLGERALAIDPENARPKEFIAKVAAAAALAASSIEDDTVDLQKGEVDPDATAVMEPVASAPVPIEQPSLAQRLWSSLVSGGRGRGSAT
jgi:serine/threonine-protein kinase